MVNHENSAKRNWETTTGDHSKAKYYQGQARNEYLRSFQGSSPIREVGYNPLNWEPTINVLESVSQASSVRASPVTKTARNMPFACSSDPQTFDELQQLES